MDIFSGIGGLSYGFSKNPNFDILIANELNEDISKGYRLNHPTVNMINCDICNLTEEKLKESLNGKQLDLIIGGPPCQSYSTIGLRHMDARASLFLQYKRILEICQPKAFIFENVKGILSMDKGNLFPKIIQEFNNIGYEIKYKLLDSANYGVPQHRERVIIVGMKGTNTFEYPPFTHGLEKDLKPFVTLRDAIGDLPSMKSNETNNSCNMNKSNDFLSFVRDTNGIITDNTSVGNGDLALKRISALKEGQGKESLPKDLIPISGFNNTWARLWWDKPSTTITRNFSCASSSRCIHPVDNRTLSIREGARLQSFPDSYKFYGNSEIKHIEIGNAVPPLLSIALASSMLNALSIYPLI